MLNPHARIHSAEYVDLQKAYGQGIVAIQTDYRQQHGLPLTANLYVSNDAWRSKVPAEQQDSIDPQSQPKILTSVEQSEFHSNFSIVVDCLTGKVIYALPETIPDHREAFKTFLQKKEIVTYRLNDILQGAIDKKPGHMQQLLNILISYYIPLSSECYFSLDTAETLDLLFTDPDCTAFCKEIKTAYELLHSSNPNQISFRKLSSVIKANAALILQKNEIARIKRQMGEADALTNKTLLLADTLTQDTNEERDKKNKAEAELREAKSALALSEAKNKALENKLSKATIAVQASNGNKEKAWHLLEESQAELAAAMKYQKELAQQLQASERKNEEQHKIIGDLHQEIDAQKEEIKAIHMKKEEKITEKHYVKRSEQHTTDDTEKTIQPLLEPTYSKKAKNKKMQNNVGSGNSSSETTPPTPESLLPTETITVSHTDTACDEKPLDNNNDNKANPEPNAIWLQEAVYQYWTEYAASAKKDDISMAGATNENIEDKIRGFYKKNEDKKISSSKAQFLSSITNVDNAQVHGRIVAIALDICDEIIKNYPKNKEDDIPSKMALSFLYEFDSRIHLMMLKNNIVFSQSRFAVLDKLIEVFASLPGKSDFKRLIKYTHEIILKNAETKNSMQQSIAKIDKIHDIYLDNITTFNALIQSEITNISTYTTAEQTLYKALEKLYVDPDEASSYEKHQAKKRFLNTCQVLPNQPKVTNEIFETVIQVLWAKDFCSSKMINISTFEQIKISMLKYIESLLIESETSPRLDKTYIEIRQNVLMQTASSSNSEALNKTLKALPKINSLDDIYLFTSLAMHFIVYLKMRRNKTNGIEQSLIHTFLVADYIICRETETDLKPYDRRVWLASTLNSLRCLLPASYSIKKDYDDLMTHYALNENTRKNILEALTLTHAYKDFLSDNTAILIKLHHDNTIEAPLVLKLKLLEVYTTVDINLHLCWGSACDRFIDQLEKKSRLNGEPALTLEELSETMISIVTGNATTTKKYPPSRQNTCSGQKVLIELSHDASQKDVNALVQQRLANNLAEKGAGTFLPSRGSGQLPLQHKPKQTEDLIHTQNKVTHLVPTKKV